MKERPGMLLENQTPRGKQNPLPAALNQRHAKTCFQIPHLLRDARLRNSEPVGCAAKASRFGNCEKIAKVTNIQRLRHGKRQYCSAGSANAMRSLTAKEPARRGGRTPSEFGVDCGPGFCLHRQNLSGYFQNQYK